MEFTASRNEFAQAVTSAAGGVPANPVIPVRAGLYLKVADNVLSVTGSDGDVTFTATCPVDSGQDGEAVVPGRLFADVVKSLPDHQVNITASDAGILALHAGSPRFTFRTLDGYYPEPAKPAEVCGAVDGSVFADAIKRVAFASAKTDSTPAYTSVLLEAGEALEAVATDRYRLAAVTMEWTPAGWDTPTALVPSWAAERFCRGLSGEVHIGWDDRVVTLRAGDFTVTARLLAGDFPQWRKILPEAEPGVILDAEAFKGAVRRASLASENDSPVELSFRNGELQIEAAGSSGKSSEIIGTSYDGGFTALFGIQKLLDGLNACDGVCRMGFTTPEKPVYIYSGGDYRYMVLPRRKI